MRATARPDALRGLAAGAAAGLVGDLAMIAAQAAWARTSGRPIRPARDDVAQDVRDGDDRTPSTILGARALARGRPDRPLPAPLEPAAGVAFHLGFGVGLGALYGLLVEYVPLAGAAAGVPFGVLQYALADPLAVPAVGLSAPPGRSSAASQRYALAGHTVFAVATELTRRALRSSRNG